MTWAGSQGDACGGKSMAFDVILDYSSPRAALIGEVMPRGPCTPAIAAWIYIRYTSYTFHHLSLRYPLSSTHFHPPPHLLPWSIIISFNPSPPSHPPSQPPSPVRRLHHRRARHHLSPSLLTLRSPANPITLTSSTLLRQTIQHVRRTRSRAGEAQGEARQ